MAFNFKHSFVLASIIGSIFVGSINNHFRIIGFALCVVGNIYWIWYHDRITKDKEMFYVFAAYFVINGLAIANNYYDGLFVW